MKPFRTEIDVPGNRRKIDYNTFSLFIGSCFVENIGSNLMDFKFPVTINPFGVLYTPVSIYNSLSILLEKRLFTEKDLFNKNGLWHSFSHHSSFSHPDKEFCLQTINNRIEEASVQLKKSDFLFITFGTARIYQLKETGETVSNNHKLPHNKFDRRLLSVGEIVSTYDILIKELHNVNFNLQIVFTLSPVRHWKDGATGNLISKSTLILAISRLIDSFGNVSYFPAYELIMDDLRDYRFYDDDMIHINKQGIDYIWKKFSNSFISPATLPVMKEITAIRQGLEHRPFNPESPEYHLFLTNLLTRIGEIEMLGTSADFTREKALIRAMLNNPAR